MQKLKKKHRIKHTIVLFLWLLLIVGTIISFFFFIEKNKNYTGYLASETYTVSLYDKELNNVDTIVRGTKIKCYPNNIIQDEYVQIKLDNKKYYTLESNIVKSFDKVVLEKNIYVRTSYNLKESPNSSHLLNLVNKGDMVEVIGFDKLNDDGSVNMYKVKANNDIMGYFYSKYSVFNYEESLKNYDSDGLYSIHAKRGNTYGGGSAADLDYYPVVKETFTNNKMPDNVYALYLNATSTVIKNVDKYIDYAKTTNINTFVVDIKDNGVPGYKSEVMKLYSATNYKYAQNSLDNYKNAIKKIKDAGFYVVGRITVFKDNYYVADDKTNAISYPNGSLIKHQDSYWPSAYSRAVWEFNVELAKEAIKLFKFNEIQFDYVRFPDGMGTYEKNKNVDYKNKYKESKAQAIQRFVMYACNELHELEVYVSIDVFGESAHTYVTSYGQYFPAISNVADVISPMPYPDHFNKYEYGFKEVVWTVPYKLLKFWGTEYVMKRQKEIVTPAIVRNWVQTYNSIRSPYITYDSEKVIEQITGLYESGLTGGYMTWNSSSSLDKYISQKDAYVKEYGNENN